MVIIIKFSHFGIDKQRNRSSTQRSDHILTEVTELWLEEVSHVATLTVHDTEPLP